MGEGMGRHGGGTRGKPEEKEGAWIKRTKENNIKELDQLIAEREKQKGRKERTEISEWEEEEKNETQEC